MGLIDLHAHTTASDGTLAPAELVRYAAARGLRAVAVTDHDTVDGLTEALGAGEETGLEVVPGVEISVDYPRGEMHILGYFIDPKNGELLAGLELMRGYRDRRNPLMAEKLRQLGFDITMEEVTAAAGGGIVGRPHFASVMKEKGYVGDYSEAFEKYLGAGRPAYVKKERFTPREGIELILDAGGIPVLAHPKYLDSGGGQLDGLVRVLMGYGLKGLEVYYSTHTLMETDRYRAIADRHGLLATGGTDFHGASKPDIEIGTGDGSLAVGYDVLEKLKKARPKR